MSDGDLDDALNRAKLAALAEFAAGAGHEINNPLATILGRTELLLRRVERLAPSGEAAEAARDLNIIAGQVQRIRDMIGDLMLFARPPAPKLEDVSLSEIARGVLESFASRAAAEGIELRGQFDEGVVVRADRVQLAVVVSELLRNAFQATPRGGSIRATITIADDLQRIARLAVEDDGAGLSDSDMAHLFDPFYSGRPAGRGLGFGLCKCWRIMQTHGGMIAIVNQEKVGVLAITEWPMGG
ncbi:MAG TPA: HAMP domain-containing sensor histidine kinase [Caulifigura sp.]|nr:HAMP domain-containing sensor histidine kinase [Caulifigura sp.]